MTGRRVRARDVGSPRWHRVTAPPSRGVALAALVATLLALQLVATGAGAGPAATTVARRATIALPDRQMTLAQAPPALRAAVRRTIGRPATVGGNLEKAELTGNGGAGAEFGVSVAIGGTTAIVGAEYDNSNAGAAYVFVESGGTWTKQTELTAGDAASGDFFGAAVGISGNNAIVGAPGRTSDAGAVYLFGRTGSTWTQEIEVAHTIGDRLGSAVAISGTWAMAGGYTDAGYGFVELFQKHNTSWGGRGGLFPPTTASNQAFGFAVAMTNTLAVVGAPGTSTGTGAAYVYSLVGNSSWSEDAEITASDGATGDLFGNAVSIVRQAVLIGAPGKGSDAGRAYIFSGGGTVWTLNQELNGSGTSGDYFGGAVTINVAGATPTAVVGAFGAGGSGVADVYAEAGSRGWVQEAVLQAEDAASGDDFAYSVASTGSSILAGAPLHNSSFGAAYVFTVSAQQAVLAGASSGELFGQSVAIAGSTAVICACNSNTSKGSVDVFVRKGTRWMQQTTLTASDGVAGDLFGSALAYDGATLVIGASGKNSDTGAAYVFSRSGSTWSQVTELTAPGGGSSGDAFGSAVAVAGSSILVGAYGKYTQSGVAYTYLDSGGTWGYQSELFDPLGAADDSYGIAVALATNPSSTLAAIGAPGSNAFTGAVYTYQLVGGIWYARSTLTASGGASNDQFGQSVAMENADIIVGAPGTNNGTGSAYVFAHNGSGWVAEGALDASDGTAHDRLGTSVSVSGSEALVGAQQGLSGTTGAAYVFLLSGNAEQEELTATDALGGDEFGHAVGLWGTTAVVGTDEDQGGTPPPGEAFIYQLP